jgi:hypothetical protein
MRTRLRPRSRPCAVEGQLVGRCGSLNSAVSPFCCRRNRHYPEDRKRSVLFVFATIPGTRTPNTKYCTSSRIIPPPLTNIIPNTSSIPSHVSTVDPYFIPLPLIQSDHLLAAGTDAIPLHFIHFFCFLFVSLFVIYASLPLRNHTIPARCHRTGSRIVYGTLV